MFSVFIHCFPLLNFDHIFVLKLLNFCTKIKKKASHFFTSNLYVKRRSKAKSCYEASQLLNLKNIKSHLIFCVERLHLERFHLMLNAERTL